MALALRVTAPVLASRVAVCRRAASAASTRWPRSDWIRATRRERRASARCWAAVCVLTAVVSALNAAMASRRICASSVRRLRSATRVRCRFSRAALSCAAAAARRRCASACTPACRAASDRASMSRRRASSSTRRLRLPALVSTAVDRALASARLRRAASARIALCSRKAELYRSRSARACVLAWAVRCVADAISASCCSTLSVLRPTFAIRTAVPWSLVSSPASDFSAARISRSAPFNPRASSLLVPAASCFRLAVSSVILACSSVMALASSRYLPARALRRSSSRWALARKSASFARSAIEREARPEALACPSCALVRRSTSAVISERVALVRFFARIRRSTSTVLLMG